MPDQERQRFARLSALIEGSRLNSVALATDAKVGMGVLDALRSGEPIRPEVAQKLLGALNAAGGTNLTLTDIADPPARSRR
jgi:hypothetical protein